MKKIGKYLRQIILTCNIVSILLLWACCASTLLHPTSFPKLSLLGLLFPGFLVSNLIFIFIWTIVDHKKIWIPIVGMLAVWNYTMDYCPITLSNEKPADCIKMLTWNSGGMGSYGENKEERKELTFQYLKNCDADIICLQESNNNNTEFAASMDSAGYEAACYRGTVIYTRFHIIEQDTIAYETEHIDGFVGNGSCWYKLQCGKDTILVVNNHLESNRLKQELKTEYVNNLDGGEYKKLEKSGRSIGSKLRASTTLRGSQADSIAALIERHKGMPTIVCGDFNDTPISYTYQRIASKMKSAFRESGNGIGLSYNEKGFWVRIDHIFVSKEWQTYNTHIDSTINTSDHFPLISWLKIE